MFRCFGVMFRAYIIRRCNVPFCTVMFRRWGLQVIDLLGMFVCSNVPFGNGRLKVVSEYLAEREGKRAAGQKR